MDQVDDMDRIRARDKQLEKDKDIQATERELRSLSRPVEEWTPR